MSNRDTIIQHFNKASSSFLHKESESNELRFSEEQKWTVIFMIKYFPNLKQIDISEILNISKSSISRLWKKYEEKGFVRNEYENCGLKRKLEQSDIEVVENMMRNNANKHLTLSSFQKELKKINNKDVHISTLSRTLNEVGIYSMKPTFIPKLSDNHKKLRIEYATTHKNDKFTNVIFTDEVFFQLNNNNTLVWHRPSEETPKPLLEKFNNRKKIKVWGGISRFKKFCLVVWDGKMNWEKYTEVLIDSGVFNDADKAYGKKKWRFMQDNARPHIKLEVINVINERCSNKINHPPNSPDLNPIEHVWGWMKKKISALKLNDLEQIEIAIEGLWSRLTKEQINNFIDHHVSKLPIIIEKNGDYAD